MELVPMLKEMELLKSFQLLDDKGGRLLAEIEIGKYQRTSQYHEM